MIYLYSDILTEAGGIETYLHALATKLYEENIPFRVAVSEQQPRESSCEMLDDLEAKGIDVYRQSYVPGDRWHVRKRLLMYWLWWQLEPGDWVYCVRQPISPLYLDLVRLVHNRGAKIAASWMFAPEFLVPDPPHYKSFCQAVQETDRVISVSKWRATQSRMKRVGTMRPMVWPLVVRSGGVSAASAGRSGRSQLLKLSSPTRARRLSWMVVH